ncbi:MAG: hypothetical protein HZB10_03695 [Candidatus Yonathbacteria bacterium]|nr:hypothetical protein [Candidatus Yonathbacteria bacterium]
MERLFDSCLFSFELQLATLTYLNHPPSREYLAGNTKQNAEDPLKELETIKEQFIQKLGQETDQLLGTSGILRNTLIQARNANRDDDHLAEITGLVEKNHKLLLASLSKIEIKMEMEITERFGVMEDRVKNLLLKIDNL